MEVCVRNGISQMGLTMRDAIRMASQTPAEIIGVHDRKGSIEKGKDADIIILDEDISIEKTIIRGIVNYTKMP